MTRTPFRPIASIGLVAAVLAYVGCSQRNEATPESKKEIVASKVATAEDKSKPRKESDPKIPKFLSEWSANPPAGILLISGEQNGYPDPCGCTEGQLGGLGRRYHLCEMIDEKKWPIAKVDLGNLIHYRGDSRGGREQEKIKFDIILEALSMMRYDAVALGPEDLKIGVMDTIGTLLNSQPPKYPPFLAANVKVQQGLESTLASLKFTKAGPIKIGFTSVLDPAQYQDLQDPASNVLELKTPDEVIPELLTDLKKQAEVCVLVVQGPHDEAKRLAEKFPGFDIVIGTSKSTDPDEHAETLNGGKTLLVNNIGQKGKYVGLVGFFPGQTPMIRYLRQPLDIHFHQAEPMRQLIDFDYQDRLKREKVVENFTRYANGLGQGATYVGAESCQNCHPKTFEKWSSTKHARAYDALTNPKRPRIYDAECISCHTTGFGYKTGWVSAEATPLLKGNQCENCHGPGSKHAANPDNLDYRKPMQLSKESAESTFFCTKCHDEDNDHDFQFDNRYAQIFHKGLDDYSDPKVHEKSAEKREQAQK